jgi:hypothetical protein
MHEYGATATLTEKTFTPVEANRALPLVRSIVGDILEKAKELRDASPGSERHDDEDLELLQQDILNSVEELEELGCKYQDWNFEIGLVDFPSRIAGESVYLCWRSDEPAVAHYHPIEGGFAARQPIPAELLTRD